MRVPRRPGRESGVPSFDGQENPQGGEKEQLYRAGGDESVSVGVHAGKQTRIGAPIQLTRRDRPPRAVTV